MVRSATTQPAPDFDKVPYAVALVDIDEQPGLRLPGQVLDIDVDQVAVGMRVMARLEPLPGGSFVVPVLIPIDEGGRR